MIKYKFPDHEHEYEYLYSIRQFDVFRITPDSDDNSAISDRVIVTDNRVPLWEDESQISLECMIVEHLMRIDVLFEDIEFVDVALAIIDALGEVHPHLRGE